MDEKILSARSVLARGHMKVKVTLVALFDDGVLLRGSVSFTGKSSLLIRCPSPGFEHAAPYVVSSLATLPPNRGFQICHFDAG